MLSFSNYESLKLNVTHTKNIGLSLFISAIVYFAVFLFCTISLYPLKSSADLYRMDLELEDRSEVESLINKRLLDDNQTNNVIR